MPTARHAASPNTPGTSAAFHREGKDLVVHPSLLQPGERVRVVYSSGAETSVDARALFPDDEPSAPLSVAKISGANVRASAEFYESLGPWVTGKNMEQHFGISRQRLAQWRSEYKVLGVQFGDRRFYYPSDQFIDGRVAPGLQPVLRQLCPHFEPETIASFLAARVDDSETTYWSLLRKGELDIAPWTQSLVSHYAA